MLQNRRIAVFYNFSWYRRGIPGCMQIYAKGSEKRFVKSLPRCVKRLNCACFTGKRIVELLIEKKGGFMKLKKVKVRCAAADRELFILRPVTFPKVTVEQLAGDIANATSLTKADVTNALQCMADFLSTRLTAGSICDLGDLGILRVIIRAKAVENGGYDMKQMLKYLRYKFTPRQELKDVVRAMPFEKTAITNFAGDDGENVVSEQ